MKIHRKHRVFMHAQTNQTRWKFIVSLSAAVTTACAAATNPYIRSFDAGGQLRFELTEPTGHPHFKWPRTLLNYQIRLHGSHVDPTKLQLVDSSGDTVPFQISNLVQSGGVPQSMTLSFFSDLPSGSARSFLLSETDSPT